jgi:hypothetical protein
MMKKLFYQVVMMGLVLGCVAPVGAQTKAVVKTISTNGITESVVVPSGVSLTIKSGATFVIESGATQTVPSQSANTVYAGPTTGSAAVPTWRALVAADVPDLSGVYQPLDADLTAIAALITTSHGRSLLTGGSASDTRSTLGLVIGTDVLAPSGNGSALTALNASALASGTVPDGRFPAVLPVTSGANLTNLNAGSLASGTVPDGRFPATLPAASGANLTALNASNLSSGTVPDARFPATLPAASGANLTALNASNLSSGLVAEARGGVPTGGTTGQALVKTSNTNNDVEWATVSGGGGGASPGDEVAYVYPETGNDTTGDGTQAAPWATIQKAVNEGKSIILLGEGAAGNISVTGSLDITITGLGMGVSTVGSISASANITVQDGGQWSFRVVGNVQSTPLVQSAAGGTIILKKVYIDSFSVSSAGAVGAAAANGGNGGDISLEDCYVLNLTSSGGTGGDGDGCSAAGSGGNGGSVSLLRTWVLGSTSCIAGGAGTNNGGGDGSPGTNGSATVLWSNLNADPADVDSSTVHASLVNGTWID